MAQLAQRAVRHRPGPVRRPVEVGVMQQDHVLVAGQVDIAFHTVGAVRQSLQVGGAGVFGERGAGAPVRKDQRPPGSLLLICHADTVADRAAAAGLGLAHAGEL
ncbi:hypothetical protein ARTHROSP310_18750 [Arthrobacter sp. AD-310]